MGTRKSWTWALLGAAVVLTALPIVLAASRYEPTSKVVFTSLRVEPLVQSGCVLQTGQVFFECQFDGRFELGFPATEIPDDLGRKRSLLSKLNLLYGDCFQAALPTGMMSGPVTVENHESCRLLVKPNETYSVSLDSPLPIARYTDDSGTQRTLYIFAVTPK